MKDIKQSFKISGATVKVLAFPLVALLAILGSVFISDVSVMANQSAEMTRIAADIDESYFISQESDFLAEAGKLESRSSGEVSADESIETTETAQQCESLYIEDHLRIDFDNDSEEVLRLQSFLKTYEGYDYVSLSGTFDENTLRAVEAFQTRYAGDILTPWGYQADEATGYVYITTKQKINEIYCDEQFMLNREQQSEIRAYREKLNQWRTQGASFETPQYLATYYGYGRGGSEGTLTYSGTNELEPRDSNSQTTDDAVSETATSATSTEEDGRGFFARLFGIGNNDDTATTSTTTETESENFDENNETETATSATDTATTSSLDNIAAGVYSGVNGIVNFLLSPTFLLVVLVVLILLLIATLIESDEEEEEGDDDGKEDSDDEEEDVVEAETVEEETDSKEAWEEYAEVEDDETIEEDKE